jgi:hypothetical protein
MNFEPMTLIQKQNTESARNLFKKKSLANAFRLHVSNFPIYSFRSTSRTAGRRAATNAKKDAHLENLRVVLGDPIPWVPDDRPFVFFDALGDGRSSVDEAVWIQRGASLEIGNNIPAYAPLGGF